MLPCTDKKCVSFSSSSPTTCGCWIRLCTSQTGKMMAAMAYRTRNTSDEGGSEEYRRRRSGDRILREVRAGRRGSQTGGRHQSPAAATATAAAPILCCAQEAPVRDWALVQEGRYSLGCPNLCSGSCPAQPPACVCTQHLSRLVWGSIACYCYLLGASHFDVPCDGNGTKDIIGRPAPALCPTPAQPLTSAWSKHSPDTHKMQTCHSRLGTQGFPFKTG